MEERRGRPAAIIQEEAPRKYTKTYEDESTTETWTFDLDKAKQSRDDKRNARQMKIINERNK